MGAVHGAPPWRVGLPAACRSEATVGLPASGSRAGRGVQRSSGCVPNRAARVSKRYAMNPPRHQKVTVLQHPPGAFLDSHLLMPLPAWFCRIRVSRPAAGLALPKPSFGLNDFIAYRLLTRAARFGIMPRPRGVRQRRCSRVTVAAISLPSRRTFTSTTSPTLWARRACVKS